MEADTPARTAGSGHGARVRRFGRGSWRTPRLILAGKSALAAGLAWYLAPIIPFAEPEYSYYAPLGALVSMYPTFFDSARSGLQALAGLSLGVGLGLGAVLAVSLGVPGILGVAGVIGIGVALGGSPRWGVGRDWLPMAGLCVLVLTEGHGAEFSISYLVTMAFGVVTGVLVQWLVLPPLTVGEAQRAVAAARLALADGLTAVARVLEDPAGHPELDRRAAELARAVSGVSESVQHAHRSARANPRARRTARTASTELDAEAAGVERAGRHVLVMLELVAEGARGHTPSVSRAASRRLVPALRRCGEALGTAVDAPEHAARVAAAQRQVERCRNRTRRPLRTAEAGAGEALASSLSRALSAAVPRHTL